MKVPDRVFLSEINPVFSNIFRYLRTVLMLTFQRSDNFRTPTKPWFIPIVIAFPLTSMTVGAFLRNLYRLQNAAWIDSLDSLNKSESNSSFGIAVKLSNDFFFLRSG